VPPRITVIAHVETNDSTLAELVESFDAQSLSYRDFSVVLLVPESAAALRRRLEQLTARRPNVVIQPFEGGWSDALCSTSGAVATPLILPLSPDLCGGATRLHPEALRRLSDFFETNDCDVVLARASRSSAQIPIPFELRRDVPRIGRETAPKLLSAAALAYRTKYIRAHGPVGHASDLAEIDPSTTIGVLGSYPIVAQRCGVDDSPPQDALSPRVVEVTASWRNGRILLAADMANGEDNQTCLLSIVEPVSGLEYWLPTASDAASAWELDVRSAALGGPLSDGQWSVMSNVYAADGEPVARSSVPATALETGIVDGKLVVGASSKGTLVIDVGATRSSPVASVDVDQVHITEDVRGALFRAHLPKVYATGPGAIDGAIMLDRFRLPARLVADQQGVSLQFFVSGLAGESSLFTQFGASPAAATGLNLVISGTGEMGVTPTPPPPEPPKSPPAARPKPPRAPAVPPKPVPVLRRLRRSVPEPLEPLARRLSRNSVARRLYRRMTQR
jgi:hypothetical protein